MTTVISPQTRPSYPVHVTAGPLPDQPSRGLWLVKWLLIIPHAIVLSFLWAAFALLSLVALIAILITGRYPRSIFDFNVGVMRWSWRVSYYAYGALGTDRYPPFTLRDDPTYPARLDVEYPQTLSRGLALVKWWLLAVPHYIVVSVLTSTGWWLTRNGPDIEWIGRGGLVSLLVLIAGVALLFTGRYPQGLYDLLIGVHRWALRVAGYAGLMTDEYPPFRLDQGGGDSTEASLPTSHTDASRGAVGPFIAGSLAALLGMGMLALGTLSRAVSDDGFITSPAITIQTEGYAVVTSPARLEGSGLDIGLGPVRVQSEASDGSEIFLGVADADDATAYLSGIQHTVLGPAGDPGRDVPGGAPASGPAASDIWVASASGPGLQSVDLTAREGAWVAVVMSADADHGLEASLAIGAAPPWLRSATTTLTILGGVLLGAGVLTIALATRAAESRWLNEQAAARDDGTVER